MALFCAAIRKYSVSLLKFPFQSHVEISWEILSTCPLKYLYSCFLNVFCFLSIVVLLIFMLSMLFLVAIISLSLHSFLCSLLVVALMHPHYLQCWQVLSPVLFVIHRVCQYHLLGAMLYSSSLVFLSSGLFAEVLPSFISRMVSLILQERSSLGLSLWSDFWHLVWFWVAFSVVCDNHFFVFFFLFQLVW